MKKMTHLKTTRSAACAFLAAGILGGTYAGEARTQAAERVEAPGPATAASALAVIDAETDPGLALAMVTIIKQQEAVKNLTASGVLKTENLNQKTGNWESQEEREVTVTYDGTGAQKCQIACRLSKTPTPDGPTPFHDEKYIVICDGKVALKLTEPDTGLSIAMCEISAGRPPQMDDTARATGLAYSTLGWKEPSGGPERKSEPLLALLRESRKLPGFHAQKVMEAGREFLMITVPRPDGLDSGGKIEHELHFWLDPQKGYALGRLESYLTEAKDGKHKTWQMDVTAFAEPMPGLFYPNHIELRSFGPAKETESVILTRTTVDVSDVQVNTAVAEDTFSVEKVELPVGTSNLRDANGEVIRFTPDQQRRLFAQVARQVLAKAEKEKAATQAGRKP